MHILLPPSETKRDGGIDGSSLDLTELSFPSLNPTRRSLLAAVRSLSSNRATAAAALGLSTSQYFEVDRNRALRRSPVLPALGRYTGVLYDALDFATLSDEAREFASEHVVIHSALFGLVRAADPIPAYRLSQDSKVPNLPLGRTWRHVVSAEVDRLPGLLLDLRSESYVGLGPAPERSYFLRVVTEDSSGTRRALNHFNKKAKGEFVRAILQDSTNFADLAELLDWAKQREIRLDRVEEGELQLVV